MIYLAVWTYSSCIFGRLYASVADRSARFVLKILRCPVYQTVLRSLAGDLIAVYQCLLWRYFCRQIRSSFTGGLGNPAPLCPFSAILCGFYKKSPIFLHISKKSSNFAPAKVFYAFYPSAKLDRSRPRSAMLKRRMRIALCANNNRIYPNIK